MPRAERLLTSLQFHAQRRQIQSEKFSGLDKNPFTFGLERARFKQRKLGRLLDLAEKAEECESTRRWRSKWEKELLKVNALIERFQQYR